MVSIRFNFTAMIVKRGTVVMFKGNPKQAYNLKVGGLYVVMMEADTSYVTWYLLKNDKGLLKEYINHYFEIILTP